MGLIERDVEQMKNRLMSRTSLHRLGAGATALALAATLAACGGNDSSNTTSTSSGGATQATTTSTTAAANGVADKSADEILAEATAAAKGATAVHIAGTTDGASVDLSLVRGEGASGSIAQGTSRFDLIAIGDAIYLRGSEDFYRSLGGEAVVRLLGDKWLKVPATGRDFATFAEFTDMERLLTAALRPESTIQKGDVETVDGTEAIGLTDDRGGTLFVATTGEPFPLKLVGGGDRRGGEITFDGWNEPVTLTAPADAIDVDQLARAGN